MIKKIKKIKNLGLFSDFTWGHDLGELKRFNLVYGPNGSGKTTLSKLFVAFDSGTLETYPKLEYEIDTSSGNFTQGQSYDQKVRVFNQDYIANNIDKYNNTAKPIFILGEENKKIAEQIKSDETSLSNKLEKLKQSKEAHAKKSDDLSNKFTDIASTISLNTGGILSRTYRRPDALSKYNTVKDKQLLSEEELNLYAITLKQQEKPIVSEIEVSRVDNDGNDKLDLDEILKNVLEKCNSLMKTTAESVVLERLVKHSDISQWVEDGLIIHKKYKSTVCEYCGKSIDEDRVTALSKHFSDADKNLKEQIDLQVGLLRNIYSSIDLVSPPDKANLYDELWKGYESAVVDFKSEKVNLLTSVTSLGNSVKEKKLKTTEVLPILTGVDTTTFKESITKLNVIIKKHNLKSDNFKTEKATAGEKMEVHYLSTIRDEVEIIKKELEQYIKEQDLLTKGEPSQNILGISALQTVILGNKAKISSSQKACNDINDNLKSFLGRDDIVFEVGDGGYLIKRNGVAAENLSEGEKTAIAFTHFVIHLSDQDFELSKGIVVIDDPISSLDSSLVFRVCSFLETTIRKADQLIILTHNYEFLNHVKKWLKNDPGTKEYSRFLMIGNYYDNSTNMRSAEIVELDPLLLNYESEYHYIFSKLYHFKEESVVDQHGRISAVYHYPNMARKLMECFLSFRVPNSSTVYVKLMALSEFNKDIKSTDLSEIYNFVNSNSHLDTKTGLIQFDPTLTICGDKSIDLILKVIQQADEKHYKYMEKAVTKTNNVKQ